MIKVAAIVSTREIISGLKTSNPMQYNMKRTMTTNGPNAAINEIATTIAPKTMANKKARSSSTGIKTNAMKSFMIFLR